MMDDDDDIEFEGTIENSGSGVELPIIQVWPGQISKCADETQEVLIKANKEVFVRAGMLVQPLWSVYDASKKRKTKVTLLRAFNTKSLAYMLNKNCVNYVKHNKKEKKYTPVNPPEDVINMLLTLGHWKLKQISGCVAAPTLRSDGSIACKNNSFDEDTKFWMNWEDSFQLGEVPEVPTKEQAYRAQELILGLLRGFPFESELDKSAALAAILTVVLRGAFDLAPMFLILAHTSGSGKSYLADLISTIVNGRPCPVITSGKSEEEMEKRLGSILLESPSIISIDNMTRDLDGELLCQMCTQKIIKTRILGLSQTPDCEWRGTMFATGNNVGLVGDMARRGIVINLDANMERPELRQFEFSPIEEILENRGKYVAAALTIAKAFIASGAKCVPALAGYEGWSEFVRSPIVWLGMEDPIKSMDKSREEDQQRNAVRELIAIWEQLFGEGARLTVNDLLASAREQIQDGMGGTAFARPELRDLLLQECANARYEIEPKRLGRWLTRLNGQVFDGRSIKAQKGVNKHKSLYSLKKSTH